MTPSAPVDAVVIGGGPAGSAIGRLLASWGHSVHILDKGSDPSRGLAESLPPSTTKLLAQIGVLDTVERAGFYRTRGNTVWWGSRERRVESFGPDDSAFGYQVFRPDFDRVLLESAARAGARVEACANVRRVTFGDGVASVEYELTADADSVGAWSTGARLKPRATGGATVKPRRVVSIDARFVIDCSGRAGVVGRRFRVPQSEHRTYALVGVWDADSAWELPDPSHTVVETFVDGWAWSVPVSASTRHVGAMVGHAMADEGRGRDLTETYRSALAKAPQTLAVLGRASLQRAFACDASLYSASRYAGPQFLLVGDAGSFIDPLSSFGVKKALASAWLGAVSVHTALSDRSRRDIALEFFAAWERRVYATHLRRSSEFARAAQAGHPHAFWTMRADVEIDDGEDARSDGDLSRDPGVQRAFERFRTAPLLDLVMSPTVRFEPQPVVRGREIVLEQALAGGIRFLANVDLVKLAQIAPSYRHIPDVFEAYCRNCPPVPLPNVLGGLSLLVARGVLHERT